MVTAASGEITGEKVPQNWAKTVYYNETIHEPTTVEEVITIVDRYTRIKVLGSNHSFNNITKLPELYYGAYISTLKMDKVLKCCRGERVTVQPGITFGASEYLHKRNFGFHNMASLPHITVGAISTGTHGAGVFNGNLGAMVQVKVVTGDALVRTYRGARPGVCTFPCRLD